MGFFKKLFGIGAVAGTTVAAMKVSEKYKENNPEGAKDVNGDGKVDAADVLTEVAKAATEVYAEVADSVKEKAPQVIEAVKQTADDIL
ncbi:MAG: hypothetical protein IJB30_01460 [Clostridia bacterium]|nr:hypothetical protein [Clostridia bacterium]MBQ4610380.1 hypothetical protein [Clostridia bacterium]